MATLPNKIFQFLLGNNNKIRIQSEGSDIRKSDKARQWQTQLRLQINLILLFNFKKKAVPKAPPGNLRTSRELKVLSS